jgi:2-succinyl-6-hydroxy-2,4-cyclohexadiene-1-carboxylate synthase
VLFAEKVGRGAPVVAVHGFTQTHRSWRTIAERLAADHEFTLVDAPGHGASAAVRADLWQGAEMLGHAGGRAAYVGYSMGARLCLHLALHEPNLVTSLVLIGVHPGIVDDTEREHRMTDDDAWARRLEAVGVNTFIEMWLAQPLFSTLNATAADRPDRRTNTTEGLASSLRLAGTGSQEPLWDRLGDLAMPVLLVTGEGDAKFARLGREAAAAIGANAEVVLIPGAGHACHLERPEAFCDVLAPFLAGGHH